MSQRIFNALSFVQPPSDNASEVYERAMDMLQSASIFKRRGDNNESNRLTNDAYILISNLALSYWSQFDLEPTRSELFLAATDIAIELHLFEDALRFAGLGLGGSFSDYYSEKFQDAISKANFNKHLLKDGLTLEPSEMEVVLDGGLRVMKGFVHIDEFKDRTNAIVQTIRRTVERRKDMKKPSKGAPAKSVSIFDPYVSTARAASYAFSVKVFGPRQTNLFLEASAILDDISNNLFLLQNGQNEELASNFKYKPFLDHFYSMATILAPDGKNVKALGVTTIHNGLVREVEFTKTKKEVSNYQLSFSQDSKLDKWHVNTIIGVLEAGDSGYGNVIIRTKDKQRIRIKVNEGLGDMVRMYFEQEVEATVKFDNTQGVKPNNELQSINPIV